MKKAKEKIALMSLDFSNELTAARGWCYNEPLSGIAIERLNVSEKPNNPVKTLLRDILERVVPLKFVLSILACDGIDRRADVRGKKLPATLKFTLGKMPDFWEVAGSLDKDKTLVAPMCAFDCGMFMGGQGSAAGGIGYSETVSPTLKSADSGGNTVPDVVIFPEVARTLEARADSSPCVDRGMNVVAFHLQQDPISGVEVCPCIGGQKQASVGVAVQQNAIGEVRLSDVAVALSTNGNASGRNAPLVAVYENHAQDSRITELGDTCSTLSRKCGTGGGNLPLCVLISGCDAELNPVNAVMGTLKARTKSGGEGYQCVAIFGEGSYGAFNETGNASTLKASGGINGGGSENLVAYNICSLSSNSMKSDNPDSGIYEADTARTLDRSGGNSVLSNQGGTVVVCASAFVRKLTERECERLQGFPDDYTDVGISMTARYRCIGNSIALPQWEWLLGRIKNIESEVKCE